MYGDEVIEVDVTWPGTVSDKTWVGYIQPEDILAAKDAVKPIAVDMGRPGHVCVSLAARAHCLRGYAFICWHIASDCSRKNTHRSVLSAFSRYRLNLEIKLTDLDSMKVSTSPDTYFDEQDCTDVRMYQDAHIVQVWLAAPSKGRRALVFLDRDCVFEPMLNGINLVFNNRKSRTLVHQRPGMICMGTWKRPSISFTLQVSALKCCWRHVD